MFEGGMEEEPVNVPSSLEGEVVVQCYCRERAAEKTVYKAGPNTGRKFLGCATRKCQFFKWKQSEESTSGKGAASMHSVSSAVCAGAWSATHFYVYPAYCSHTKAVVTDLGGVYNKHRCHYELPWSKYRNLLARVSGVRELPAIPERVVSTMQGSRDLRFVTWASLNVEEKESIPMEMVANLKPFQRDGVAKGIRNRGNVLLGDEMGLGKTLQALSIAVAFSDDWPLLIICPSSLKANWKAEITKWLTDVPGLNTETDVTIVRNRDTANLTLINIVGYEQLARMDGGLMDRAKELFGRSFQTVVCDEAHYLKTPTAKRTAATRPICVEADHCIFISGTPALSRPIEMYSVLNILEPQLFPSIEDYGKRYCDGKDGKFGTDYSGSSNLSELNALLQKTVLIRRLKRDVLGDLPEKNRNVISVGVTPGYMQQLASIRKNVSELSAKIDSLPPDSPERKELIMECKALTTWSYSLTAEAKCNPVCEVLEKILRADSRKLLVFAHHEVMMSALADFLRLHGTKFIKIDGGTKIDDRPALCEDFSTDPDCRVGLLSILAAGAGLNFTAASHTVFAELTWNPGSLTQAEDRIHRLGQESAVDIDYVIADGTIDNVIWYKVEKKLNVLSSSLDGDFSEQNMLKDPSKIANIFRDFERVNSKRKRELGEGEEGGYIREQRRLTADSVDALLAEDDDDLFVRASQEVE